MRGGEASRFFFTVFVVFKPFTATAPVRMLLRKLFYPRHTCVVYVFGICMVAGKESACNSTLNYYIFCGFLALSLENHNVLIYNQLILEQQGVFGQWVNLLHNAAVIRGYVRRLCCLIE